MNMVHIAYSIERWRCDKVAFAYTVDEAYTHTDTFTSNASAHRIVPCGIPPDRYKMQSWLGREKY